MAPPQQSLSNLPLQVLIFVNSWYDVVYFILTMALFIWKGSELPYRGSLGGLLALEVCLVVVLAILEYCRLFLASRGNKTETHMPLIFSLLLAIPCGIGFMYYLNFQVYVARLDIILNCIALALIGLELFLSLITVLSICRAPPKQ